MVIGAVFALKDNEMKKLESQSVSIEGVQSAFMVSFAIKQSFKNNLGSPVEVRYVFPTDGRICIYDISFTLDGKEIKMDLKEKAAAEATFKEAVSNGQTAVISRSLPNNLDEFVIGNLDVQGVCEVKLHCSLTSTSSSDSSHFFKFPLDRVLPNGSSESLCRSISGQFQFSVDISQPSPILSVSSNCGGRWTPKNENEGSFAISTKPELNAIIVTTTLKQPMKSFASLNGKYISASLYPNLPADSISNSDFIFLVDCSGSMMSGRIQMAANCLKYFLRSLPPGCGFDIVRFGSNHVSLFNDIEPYNDASLAKGIELAEMLPREDLGGTEILAPLMSIFSRPQKTNRVRQIFVISDGEVSNTDSVISHVAVNRGSHRIFTVGVGTGADAGLINGLAEVSMGQSVFVKDGDDLTSVVMNQLEAALSPAVTDLQFHVEGCDNFEVTPFPLPPAFNSTSQTFLLKLDHPSQAAILCSGSVEKSPIDLTFETTVSSQERGCEALFAFRLISDLMRKIKVDRESGKNINDLRAKVVELSLMGGVLSEYTAFVGVSEHKVRNEGVSGGGETFRSLCRCNAPMKNFNESAQDLCLSSSKFSRSSGKGAAKPSKKGGFFNNLFSGKSQEPTYNSPPPPCPAATAMPQRATLSAAPAPPAPCKRVSAKEIPTAEGQDIIQSQSSGGYWEMKSLSGHLKGPFGLPSNIDTSKLDAQTLERVKATVAAIALLRKNAMDKHNEWKLMERKALQFLKSMIASVDWDQVINSAIATL